MIGCPQFNPDAPQPVRQEAGAAARPGGKLREKNQEMEDATMAQTDLPKPDYARNMRLVGYSDQGGRPDGCQLMVHRGYAYVGHMFSKGFSIVDVRDARNPRTVNYLAAPANTWNIHLQT